MSVINKMLKDLERNQQQAQPEKITAVATERYIYKLLWLLIFIILALIVWDFKGSLFGSKIEKTTSTQDKASQQITEVIATNDALKSRKDSKSNQSTTMALIEKKQKTKLVNSKNELLKKKPMEKVVSTVVVAEIKKEDNSKKIKPENLVITRNVISAEETAKALWKQAESTPLSAEKLLKESLSLAPALDGARLQLIALLVSQRRMSAAENIVDKGLLRSPENARYIEWKARFRIAAKEKQIGFQWLLKYQPNIETHTSYYGLLAGIASQLELHEKALETYKQLVQVQPNHGPWLLGLAISLEQLGKKEQAISFYKRARLSQGLTAKSQLFIQQKLNKLEP